MPRFARGAISAICSIAAFTRLPMAEAFAPLFLLPSSGTIFPLSLSARMVRGQRWTAVIRLVLSACLSSCGQAGELDKPSPVRRSLAGVGQSRLSSIARSARRRNASRFMVRCCSARPSSAAWRCCPEMWPTAWQFIFLASYGLLGTVGTVLVMNAAHLAPGQPRCAAANIANRYEAIGFGYCYPTTVSIWPMALGIVLIVFSGPLTLARERKRGTPLRAAAAAADTRATLEDSATGTNADAPDL